MNKSESIINIMKAISAAQAELPALKLDASNEFAGTRYSSIKHVMETVKPVLKKNGLALLQPITNDGDRIGVETVLLHESGEWISVIGCMALQAEKGKGFMQVAGSAVSYLRRYGIISTLGLYADEDEHAGMPQVNKRAAAPQQAQSKPVANGAEQQYKYLDSEIVMTCSKLWKCSNNEAAQTLSANAGSLPGKTLSIKQAAEWAAKIQR